MEASLFACLKVFSLCMAGPPNSGKGVVTRRLLAHIARLTGVTPAFVSAREVLASPLEALVAMGVPHDLAQQVPTIRASGRLVPRTIIQPVMSAALRGLREVDGLVIDGFPRIEGDDEVLDAHRPITHAVILTASDDIIAERALGRWTNPRTKATFSVACDGIDLADPRDPVTSETLIRRPDDNADKVPVRLETFRTQTAVTVEAYVSQRPHIKRGQVDTSHLSPAEVVNHICTAFGWPVAA